MGKKLNFCISHNNRSYLKVKYVNLVLIFPKYYKKVFWVVFDWLEGCGPPLTGAIPGCCNPPGPPCLPLPDRLGAMELLDEPIYWLVFVRTSTKSKMSLTLTTWKILTPSLSRMECWQEICFANIFRLMPLFNAYNAYLTGCCWLKINYNSAQYILQCQVDKVAPDCPGTFVRLTFHWLLSSYWLSSANHVLPGFCV